MRVDEYKLSSWTGIIGKLILDDQKAFSCNVNKPFSIFNKNTWAYYEVQVTNGVNAVAYKLKIDLTFISTIGTRFRPFSGEIELWGDNVQLVFAGLFLLEHVFEKEDNSSF